MSELRFKETYANLPIYAGGNSFEMLKEMYGLDDIIKMSSNENPLPTSPAVSKALHDLVDGLNRYPPVGDDQLKSALSAYIGRETTDDMYVTGNGGCDILRMVADGFLTEEDEAIICKPTFLVYELTVKRIGAKVVEVPLNRDDFSYDVDRILAAVTDKTKLLYLCSPNNPTGTIMTQGELDRLMAGLPDHVLVVADEVYYHFKTDPAAADFFPYLDRNMVIIHSFSKVFGLGGLRLGYGIARPEIAGYLSRMRLPFHINQMTLFGGMAGLSDRDHIEETISLTIDGRAEIEAAFDEMEGVHYWPSQTNFVCFKTVHDSLVVEERLQREGILVREVTPFYLPGHLRVSVGTPQENARFVGSLKKVLAELD